MEVMRSSQRLLRFFPSLLFLGALLGVYIWNAWQYNTWWSYDGGAHVQYIYGLAKDRRLPNPQQNYLAWHEPLYYILNALVVKVLLRFDISDTGINKILQLESAGWAWLLVIAAGILAWRLNRRPGSVFFVVVFTGSLFITSALGRYVTNEVMFQSLLLWWLVLFFYWEMFAMPNWKIWRWLILGLGLLVLVWIKLSGFILLFALGLWLVWLGFIRRSRLPFLVAGLAVILVGVGYSPWLIHKHRLYGNAFTINNFETVSRVSVSKKMPLAFYTTINADIFRTPFWPAGKESFWSMFYASSLSDYDNIFQNYEQKKVTVNRMLKTENGRMVSLTYAARSVAFYWWSLPLAVMLIIGGGIYFYLVFLKEPSSGEALLFIIGGGLLGALVYNTYQYPYLDRGIMKTIFIASFFPLLAIIASRGWNYYVEKNKKKHQWWVYLASGFYFILWVVFSWSLLILPS